MEYNLLSQYHYINPISTEFQYPQWLVSFLLLALPNLVLYVFSSFFNAATASPILMQSAGPALTSDNIPWHHIVSSFISFSVYSFHKSLIHFSSKITLLDTPFTQFDLVTYCLSFAIWCAIRQISFWCSGSFKSLAYSFCFFSFAEEITLFALCLLFLYSFHASVEFFDFHFLYFISSFSLLLQQPPHSTTLFPSSAWKSLRAVAPPRTRWDLTALLGLIAGGDWWGGSLPLPRTLLSLSLPWAGGHVDLACPLPISPQL